MSLFTYLSVLRWEEGYDAGRRYDMRLIDVCGMKWVLTEENVMEPPALLKKALARKGIEETGVFDVVDLGESREF